VTSNVGDRLSRLLEAIAPTTRELEAAEQRANRISTRLSKDFDIRRVSYVGSHSKGTAVRSYSDVDLLIVVSRDEARKWSPNFASSTLVARVRRSLASTYPQSSLRVDRQAVRIAFDSGDHAVDVVPAIFGDFDDKNRVPTFLIPDGKSGWLRTSPDLHRRLVDEADERAGRRVKPLVRLLKWWAASRALTSSLSSLYLEWFTIGCQIPVGTTYQQSLVQLFSAMVSSKLPPLQDPYGISEEPVRAARTGLQAFAILEATKQSARRAERAIFVEGRGKDTEALAQWRLVFNGRFPMIQR
jgi:hypothetical protein